MTLPWKRAAKDGWWARNSLGRHMESEGELLKIALAAHHLMDLGLLSREQGLVDKLRQAGFSCPNKPKDADYAGP